MLFKQQTTAAQTAFAALSSASLLGTVRTIAQLPGSFSKKKIKGIAYWYYQTPNLLGGQKQIFVGPASQELTSLVNKHRQGDAAALHLRRLARQCVAAGCPAIAPAHAKILARLADAGFFQAGGILVGAHVFMAYLNYLGVQWASGTQALAPDFAQAGKNVSIAIPSDVVMDMGSVIESLEMGFVPVQSLTNYVKSDETDLQIDFVTSLPRGGDTPVLIKSLNATIRPLKFMEFLMAAPIQLSLLSNQGAIVVNAPPPEKYAVHKLLVHGERPQNMRIKAAKDLDQAATLIEYLTENDADALSEAWADMIGLGPGWLSRAELGLKALQKRYPELNTRLLASSSVVRVRKLKRD